MKQCFKMVAVLDPYIFSNVLDAPARKPDQINRIMV